jgi:anaerobic carbon-monoxide dehydrogenase iron sulfur subunit
MTRRIVFDESLCTNCHLCAMFCSLAFGENGVYEFRPFIARIRPVENADGTKYVAHVCLQCTEPACAGACPVEAISRDPATGLVVIDEEECIGCESCIEACEYDCIFMVDDKAVKCEVCDDPLCVKACAVKAIQVMDTDETAIREQAQLYREIRL